MRNRDMRVIWRTGAVVLLLLGLGACSKKEPPAPDASEATGGVATAAAALNCHPALQKLMEALPVAHEMNGQKETARDCKSGMVFVAYGTGEPYAISFELTALKYAESDLEPMGEKGGQDLLDNLRKTMEVKYTLLESQIHTAKLTAGDASVDVMSPTERAQLPREVTLPNGVKAIVSRVDGNGWELASVMSDRHMLVMRWSDASKESTTDEAAAVFGKLAAAVAYDKLK